VVVLAGCASLRASLCRSLASNSFAKATDGVEKVPDGLVAPTEAAIPRQRNSERKAAGGV